MDPGSRSTDGYSDSEDEDSPTTSRASKRLSRRQREREEEIRENLRKEVEEELKIAKELEEGGDVPAVGKLRYPLRTLNDDELNAVTSSGDFLDFVDRSSKVIERALDEEYDVLADYELGGFAEDDDDEEYANSRKREIKQVHQFWDERWSKKRMISDICFSPKVCLFIFMGPAHRADQLDAVSRTCFGFIYEKPRRSSRPGRPCASLESTSTWPP